jgi:DNA-directed RNA polymerase specialized sigma subunit
VDWRRKEQGRRRPPSSITGLPELEQQVYRCIYLRGMSRSQCLNVLRPRFPELTEQQVADINGRLFALLTPQQRWQLSLRTPASRPVLYSVSSDEDEPAWQLAEPGPGPEDLAGEMLEQRLLREALAELPPQQRLLLRLRYEQDLTLTEVARLTRQPDPFRANRQVHAALQALAKLMEARHSCFERKNR